MILGSVCSRTCRFCNVETAAPKPVDEGEPDRVADAVAEMGLSEVVITSVTRDDLPDGGASIWARSILGVRKKAPEAVVEVLIPDFGGSAAALNKVIESAPDVLGHNLETVPSLYSSVRPQASVQRSLELLSRAHEKGLVTKTGIMLGLGETREEVIELMKDAREAGVDIFFMGQYLQPTKAHHPVVRFVEPSEFEEYREIGINVGFSVVASAPMIRSSFHTEEQKKFVESKVRGK